LEVVFKLYIGLTTYVSCLFPEFHSYSIHSHVGYSMYISEVRVDLYLRTSHF